MRIEIKGRFHSIPAQIIADYPKFSVIFGPNGSGKTHFLRAIKSEHSTVKIDGIDAKEIALIEIGQLLPKIKENHGRETTRETDKLIYNIIRDAASLLEGKKPSITEKDILSSIAMPKDENIKHEVKRVLRTGEELGKTINEVTLDDVRMLNHGIGLYISNQDFSIDIAGLFKHYHTKLIENYFRSFLHERGHAEQPGLTHEEFEAYFGKEPWVIVGEILKRCGLPYEINHPEGWDYEAPYKVELSNPKNGERINVSDLSSGEQALMALGLSTYTFQFGQKKPDLLLLDEPDAPLHPGFSKLLVEIVEEIIVGHAGIPVIMTTHSPSTLAMAQEDAIYEMNPREKKLRKAQKSSAIRSLSSGIEHLHIFKENRRQIFVEGPLDVENYGRIFSALNSVSRFNFDPIFLEPKISDSSANDVIAIVRKLNSMDSSLARGIIDWDTQNKESKNVYVLGGGVRYALDNYILDPLFLGITLARSPHTISFQDLGANVGKTFREIEMMKEDEAQNIVDKVLLIMGIENQKDATSTLENGWSLKYPTYFFEMNGHDWQKMIFSKFTKLETVTQGKSGDNKLKRPVVGVIEELPGFLPKEIRQTLEALV